jgi:hypothetical protein
MIYQNPIANAEKKMSDEMRPHALKLLNSLCEGIVTHVDELTDRDKGHDFTDCCKSLGVWKGWTRTIAWRTRRFEYAGFNDFTIRTEVRSGNMTDLEKLRKFNIDFLLYTINNADNTDFCKFVLINLHDFFEIYDELSKFKLPGTPVINNDGSKGMAFRYKDYSKAIEDCSEDLKEKYFTERIFV